MHIYVYMIIHIILPPHIGSRKGQVEKEFQRVTVLLDVRGEVEYITHDGSMYGISTYIWLICKVNVGKYTSPMDPVSKVGQQRSKVIFHG